MKLRTILGTAAVVLLAGWIQAVSLSRLAWRGEWPDLGLVCVILLPLFHGHQVGLMAGLISGLWMGFAVGQAAPAFFLSRAVTGAAADGLQHRWHSDNLLVQVLAVALGTVLCELVFALLAPRVLGADWGWRVLARAGLNALVAPPVAAMLRRLRLADPEEAR